MATISTGERIGFRTLVSSLALPVLVGLAERRPPEIDAAARALRHVSVMNLNLGFDRPSPRPEHWIYFPEPEVSFYRAGIYSNLCATSVPEGRSAFYVEVSFRPGERPDVEPLVAEVVASLRQRGLVPAEATCEATRILEIAHGYVVHDDARPRALARLSSWLESHGILSIGRYGAWEYSAMEDAIWHGRSTAFRLLGH